MEISFVTRKDLIDELLDRILEGIELDEEMQLLLTELSKSVN